MRRKKGRHIPISTEQKRENRGQLEIAELWFIDTKRTGRTSWSNYFDVNVDVDVKEEATTAIRRAQYAVDRYDANLKRKKTGFKKRWEKGQEQEVKVKRWEMMNLKRYKMIKTIKTIENNSRKISWGGMGNVAIVGSECVTHSQWICFVLDSDDPRAQETKICWLSVP